MASLDRVLELKFKSEGEEGDLLTDLYDWALPTPFQNRRHIEKIEGTEASPQTWRMKERVNGSILGFRIQLNEDHFLSIDEDGKCSIGGLSQRGSGPTRSDQNATLCSNGMLDRSETGTQF